MKEAGDRIQLVLPGSGQFMIFMRVQGLVAISHNMALLGVYFTFYLNIYFSFTVVVNSIGISAGQR
jgi:hypothetical protein